MQCGPDRFSGEQPEKALSPDEGMTGARNGMKCPSCGFENPPENKYCGNCSRILSARSIWSFHDQAWWNLNEEEKINRLKWIGILTIIIVTLLLVLFVMSKSIIS